MTNRPPPTLSKWIFVLTDVFLLFGLGWLVQAFLPPKSSFDYAFASLVAILWVVGAWICIKPWMEEFRARNKHLENETLASAVEQIQRMEEVAGRIQTATSTWQSAQEAATRTATAAREIEEKIKANMKEFIDFTDRVNNEEKKHMNLEIEKLRRSEAEWLQVTARMLDHTFMLSQAGQRSGQPNLVNQLNNFQNAQRDSVRRMGLVAFVPELGEEYNPRTHQTETADVEPPAGSVVSEILATGYTFQGQLLRRSLVRVISPQQETPAESQPSQEEPLASAEPQSEESSLQEGIVAEPEGNTDEPASSESSQTMEEMSPEPPSAQTEPQQESEIEAQPRRRARRPDPQTSLPL